MLKLLFSNDWLRRKIASDPDVETEAGRPLLRFGPDPENREPEPEWKIPPIQSGPLKPFFTMVNKEKPMTTSVRVHVNGKYRATVVQRPGGETTVVEGNYNGGSGEKTFYLPHPAKAIFEISEEQVADGDERPA